MIKKKLFFAFAAVLLLSACQESLEQRCAREAMEYSKKNCPAPIAKGVTIDSMSFDVATHTLIYSYTLDGVIDDTATIRKNNPREQMLQQLKNATAMKPYRDAGYNFRYTYFSTKHKGQKLFEATFQEKDYR